MKKPFLAFDKVFPLLNLESMPSIAMKAARQSRDDMIQSLTAWWSTTTDDDRRLMNPSITVQWEIVVAQAWGVENFATCLLAEFWALEANAPFGKLDASVTTYCELMQGVNSGHMGDCTGSSSTFFTSHSSRRSRAGHFQAISTHDLLSSAFIESGSCRSSSTNASTVSRNSPVPHCFFLD